jgi:hypothetical protein
MRAALSPGNPLLLTRRGSLIRQGDQLFRPPDRVNRQREEPDIQRNRPWPNIRIYTFVGCAAVILA